MNKDARCAGPATLAVQAACHPACIVCRSVEAGGLGLSFVARDDGSVVADFACPAEYQGYPDRLHGGVVAMLLDAAMTQWLFSRQLPAVTARLNVRFSRPVQLAQPARVVARLERSSPPAYLLVSEVWQNEVVCATAEGTFLAQSANHLFKVFSSQSSGCGPS